MKYFERGRAAYYQRRIAEAVEQFLQGEALGEDPEFCPQERWMAMMLAGRFEDAWRESDRVLANRKRNGETCDHLPRHLRFVWDGTPLAGRDVLVRCFHGLGDVIQFIRYMPQLRQICRSVSVQAQPELLPLLASAAGIDRLYALEEEVVATDAEIELLEVPHALRSTLSTIPRTAPYLFADPIKVAAYRDLLAGEKRLRVGLAWASGVWRPERSVPISEFRFLKQMPEIVLIGLQRGPAAKGLGPDDPDFEYTNWHNNSVDDTAATMMNLDLVISTDTMVAHLAGALGIPVWTLLHFHADWRWMADREDSPWYPTMRLFRQQLPDDWTSVIAHVKSALKSES